MPQESASWPAGARKILEVIWEDLTAALMAYQARAAC
jgi:hypothetical protein